jgi:2-succinyl-5-enolpyruvyl-6-hydroxy-3-cyclohexene-1-carboxylate synthase
MLANSSPVRDWESFADPSAPPRPVLGFRGASGIDGTLSLACGVAEALGQAVLLTGDLALLHDSNGWLWRTQLRGRLAVVLINNGGGGIFEQLAIRHPAGSGMDFERLFAMPQAVDGAQLCGAYGVPHRHLTEPEALPGHLEWLLQQPLGILEIRTDRGADAGLRRRLRTMAQQLPAER